MRYQQACSPDTNKHVLMENLLVAPPTAHTDDASVLLMDYLALANRLDQNTKIKSADKHNLALPRDYAVQPNELAPMVTGAAFSFSAAC